MKRENIIRARKDEVYGLRLSEAERAVLPENPAAAIKLDHEALERVAGGMKRTIVPVAYLPSPLFMVTVIGADPSHP
jgi:mersacidin/lichenicidin family type 2 lantibiotic